MCNCTRRWQCADSSLSWLFKRSSELHSARVLWRSTSAPLVAKDRNTEAGNQASLHAAVCTVFLHYAVRHGCFSVVLEHRQLSQPARSSCWLQLAGVTDCIVEAVAWIPNLSNAVGCLCSSRCWCVDAVHGFSASQLRAAVLSTYEECCRNCVAPSFSLEWSFSSSQVGR